ncbi:MAG: hypothetical protein JXQ97_16550 [Natronospirillum sp.]
MHVFKPLLILMFGLLLASHGAATEPDDTTSTECRVGAELFKYTALNSAVSRVNWDFMSIDTANVVPVQIDCNAADISASRLIHEAYDALEVELAIGHGRYSADLLNLYGCPPSSHRSVLSGIRQTIAPFILNPLYEEQLTATKAGLLFAAVQDQVTTDQAEQCAL